MASTTPEKPPETAEKPPHRRENGPGIIIARPFGIPVYISPYWFLIAGVFIIIYANDLASTLHGSTRFIVAAAFVVLLYVSVLIHELSHSLVARSYGLPVRRILLYPLGGFSEIEREPPTPGREFLVSAAGPAVSLALAAGGYGLMHVVALDTVAGTLVSQPSTRGGRTSRVLGGTHGLVATRVVGCGRGLGGTRGRGGRRGLEATSASIDSGESDTSSPDIRCSRSGSSRTLSAGIPSPGEHVRVTGSPTAASS